MLILRFGKTIGLNRRVTVIFADIMTGEERMITGLPKYALQNVIYLEEYSGRMKGIPIPSILGMRAAEEPSDATAATDAGCNQGVVDPENGESADGGLAEGRLAEGRPAGTEASDAGA